MLNDLLGQGANILSWRHKTRHQRRLQQLLRDGPADTWKAVKPLHAQIFTLPLEQQLALARFHATKTETTTSVYHRRNSHAHLVVAYVSSQFANLPLARQMAPSLALHDTADFDITCYAITPTDHSDMRTAIEKNAPRFIDFSSTRGDTSSMQAPMHMKMHA